MPNTKNIVAILTENKIQLLITLVSVAIAIINFLVVSRLAPVTQDLQSVVKRVEALEEKSVSLAEFDQVVTRLNYLTSRVDQIYSILVNK